MPPHSTPREAAPGQGHDNVLQRCVAHGLDQADAYLVAGLGVDPDKVRGNLAEAMPFLSAAQCQDLDRDIIEIYLDASEGHPYWAWELWGQDEAEREAGTDEAE